jgi:hypothetical protein
MTTIKSTLRADWGPQLQRLARLLVPLVAIAYVAGWAMGRHVHTLNDWLAGRRPPAPPVLPGAARDSLLDQVLTLSSAGLGRKKIACQLGITEWQVRKLTRNQK